MTMILAVRIGAGKVSMRLVSRAVWGAGIAVTLLVAGCGHSADQSGTTTALQPSELRTTNPDDADWIKQKAKESGGDYNKLNADDQARLNQMTNGRGYLALKQGTAK